MRWFKRQSPTEIWDESIEGPIGDLEAAHKIRDICRSAADSAEKVAGFAGQFDTPKKKYEAERYQRAAKRAMELAMKIADDLLRDSSERQIHSLCLRGSDLSAARI